MILNKIQSHVFVVVTVILLMGVSGWTSQAQPVAAMPTFSPAAGTYSGTPSVSISCSDPSASPYYGLNFQGDPTTSSPRYTSPLSLTTSTTVAAVCAAPGYVTSPVAASTYILTTTPTPSTISFEVNPKIGASWIPANFLGFSYEASELKRIWGPAPVPPNPEFIATNTTFVNLLKNLGSGTLRFGGLSVDHAYWSRNPEETFPGSGAQAVIYPADVDQLFAFAKQAEWGVIYGLDLGIDNPSMAADEASYVSQIGRQNLVAFEIGNEPNGYAQNGTRPSTFTYADYESEFNSYFSAIEAEDSGAPIAGPVTWEGQWFPQFFQDEHQNIVLGDTHYYANDYTNPLIFEPSQVVPILDTFAPLWDPTTLSALDQPYNLPVRMAETNSEWEIYSQGDISNTFLAALWGTDYLFQLLSQGFVGMNFHGSVDFTCGTTYVGVSPLCLTNGNMTPGPLYYAMLLFHYAAAHGRTVPVNFTTNHNITAYAILQDNDTRLNVVFINKDPSNPVNAMIHPGATYTQAFANLLTAPSLLATTSVTFAGHAVNTDGTWSPGPSTKVDASGGVYNVNVPPATAIVVSFQK